MLLAMLALSAQVEAAQPTRVRLVDDTRRHVFVISIGPMDLPVMGSMEPGMAHAGMEHGAMGGMASMADQEAGMFPPVGTVRIPRDAYLYGFDYEIVDASGRVLPARLLHHLNVIDPTHRELFLPISQRMLAVGRETGPHAMPWLLFGYPVQANHDIVVSAMMHNDTDVDYHGAELRLYLKYVRHGRPWPLFEVYPFQLDVAFPAGDKAFDVPPGKSSRSYEGRPSLPGRIMVIGGHLHPYATSLSFEDVTDGRIIWEGRPIEEEAGDLEGVTVGNLYWKLGAKVSPDHIYRVTVKYDNPTDKVIPEGGMGVVGGVFIPSTNAPWPIADVTDPLYALDRMHYQREVRGTYAQIAAQVDSIKQ